LILPQNISKESDDTFAGPQWICCQLGAREHYVVPAYFHQRRRLRALLTDAWVRPNSLVEKCAVGGFRTLRDRFNSKLADAAVYHFTPSLGRFELLAKIQSGIEFWKKIQARNAWFQKEVLQQLDKSRLLETRDRSGPPNVFAYSYAARRIFEAARRAGCKTVLGQIDPGPYEEKLVASLHYSQPELGADWHAVPSSYWRDWKEELALADRIIVNSPWSRDALIESGAPAGKIFLLPLAFDPRLQQGLPKKSFPRTFTEDRPLNLLFLGSLILRKGIAEVLEAADLLINAPIVLWLVGVPGIRIPAAAASHPRIRLVGAVTRAQVHDHYRAADVFILPTHSDGFAITQLEAQAWALPIIASKQCGEVVEHEQNGLIIPEVTGAAIRDAIIWMLSNPSRLSEMSRKSVERSIQFRPDLVLRGLDTCLQ